jgi:hypothetical protein
MSEGLPAISKPFFMEEVRIPGTNQRILQEVFLPTGNLKEKSQPGLVNGVEARRRPR